MANSNVQCPVCNCSFDAGVISEHANSCINNLSLPSVASSRQQRKRKSTDWDFMTINKDNAKKTASKRGSIVSKIKSSEPFKLGNSKVTENEIKNVKMITISQLENNYKNENSSSSSDVELVGLSENENSQLKQKLIAASVSKVSENSKTEKRSMWDQLTAKDSKNKGENSNIAVDSGIFNEVANNKGDSKDGKATLMNKEHANFFKDKLSKKLSSTSRNINMPLAERARPQSLDKFIGQQQAVGRNSILRNLINSAANIPSMILWGPPGCGKTTLAKIISHQCKERGNTKFVTMSATSASVNDVKEIAKIARNDQKMLHRKTILFLDEIHRFNKTQQDVLLPHVEDGTITLIGATTENPSFYVNSALLSRCRVITLEKLEVEDVTTIIKNSLPLLGVHLEDEQLEKQQKTAENESESNVTAESGSAYITIDNLALDTLVSFVDGDARTALNGLQLAVDGSLAQARQAAGGENNPEVRITVDVVKEALQRSHVLYDKKGEEHYNLISALIKSMRGSDASAALYWMMRILEGGENPLFIARRLVIFASEDVGLADPLALPQAVSTHQACHVIGMPECALNLAQCVTYLSRAPKSNEVYRALKAARNCVKNHEGPLPPVPLHLRNAPTQLMRTLGYGKDYLYPPDFTGPIKQDYFPASLIGTDFFKAS